MDKRSSLLWKYLTSTDLLYYTRIKIQFFIFVPEQTFSTLFKLKYSMLHSILFKLKRLH